MAGSDPPSRSGVTYLVAVTVLKFIQTGYTRPAPSCQKEPGNCGMRMCRLRIGKPLFSSIRNPKSARPQSAEVVSGRCMYNGFRMNQPDDRDANRRRSPRFKAQLRARLLFTVVLSGEAATGGAAGRLQLV